MSNRGGTVILSDGDLGALIALVHAAESSLASDSSGPSDLFLLPSVESASPPGALLQRQAAANSASILDPLPYAMRSADRLLAAGRLAEERGASRVVWAAHAGVPLDPESVDLDRAAAIANSALLVERLLEVESGDAAMIEAPFADLSDRQMADLAIDLGLLPGEVWWAGRAGDDQLRAAERWSAAFEASGVPLREPASKTARRSG